MKKCFVFSLQRLRLLHNDLWDKWLAHCSVLQTWAQDLGAKQTVKMYQMWPFLRWLFDLSDTGWPDNIIGFHQAGAVNKNLLYHQTSFLSLSYSWAHPKHSPMNSLFFWLDYYYQLDGILFTETACSVWSYDSNFIIPSYVGYLQLKYIRITFLTKTKPPK